MRFPWYETGKAPKLMLNGMITTDGTDLKFGFYSLSKEKPAAHAPQRVLTPWDLFLHRIENSVDSIMRGDQEDKEEDTVGLSAKRQHLQAIESVQNAIGDSNRDVKLTVTACDMGERFL
jgi:hypothetical protein